MDDDCTPKPTFDTNAKVAFGTVYSDWKGWNAAGFGHLESRYRANYRREIDAMVKFCNLQISDVLEIGFGNGGFLTFCKEAGWRVAGTEISMPLVEAAKAKGFEVVHASDLDHFPNQRNDLIAAFDVIEHIPEDQVLGFLITIKKKLKPNGVLLLRFPNSDCWLGNQNFNGDPTHVTAMGHFKLEYFCQRAGLDLVKFCPEQRLGFDVGFGKGLHALIAGPIISLIGFVIRILYFPRSRIVLTTHNVIAYVKRK
jgi:SAM-dependent methyltransferase